MTWPSFSVNALSASVLCRVGTVPKCWLQVLDIFSLSLDSIEYFIFCYPSGKPTGSQSVIKELGCLALAFYELLANEEKNASSKSSCGAYLHAQQSASYPAVLAFDSCPACACCVVVNFDQSDTQVPPHVSLHGCFIFLQWVEWSWRASNYWTCNCWLNKMLAPTSVCLSIHIFF